MTARFLVLAHVLLAMLAACVGAPMPDDRVHVRVRNDGPVPWQGMWLGAGGPQRNPQAYGPLAPGAVTRYRALPPVLANYRKSDVLVRPGLRYTNIVYPERHVGTRTLAPGHYTFAYAIEGVTLRLEISRDR